MAHSHQICQSSKPKEVDSIKTNQTGASDAIVLRSCGKLKTLYLHYQCGFGYLTCHDCHLH